MFWCECGIRIGIIYDLSQITRAVIRKFLLTPHQDTKLPIHGKPLSLFYISCNSSAFLVKLGGYMHTSDKATNSLYVVMVCACEKHAVYV